MTADFDSLRRALSAFGLDDPSGRLQVCFGPDVAPDAGSAAIILGVPHTALAALRATLADRYPLAHTLLLAFPTESANTTVSVRLSDLESVPAYAGEAALLVPALHPEEDVRDFAGLVALIQRLRDPDSGCPWDREQTHETLKRYLLEEAYETLGALDTGEPAAVREELGDLLLQIVLHARIAEQSGEFELRDVIESINTKLLRRHPHVFGDLAADTAEQVAWNWDELKRAEKEERDEDQSALGGVPKAMPALAYCQTVLGRAERAGFKWPARSDILAKVAEEAGEISAVTDSGARREELGDLLFALVSFAKSIGVDAEEAVRMAAGKFTRRFQMMERLARTSGRSLSTMDEVTLRDLWSEAKRAAAVPE